ncbi:MAG: sugar phosphate isomerase/epimerase [Planctomycetaceae bacterium]|nr:sugar phosphate isomerase/epimerase [Planctomycetaceae bacterium]
MNLNETNLTRRQALICSTGMAVAAAIRPLWADSSGDGKSAITLGYSTYPLPNHSPKDAIELIANTGFDSLELTVTPDREVSPGNLNAAARKALRSHISDRGLKLTSLMEHIPVGSDDKEHQSQLDRLRAAAELGHALSPEHPPVIQTVLGGKDWEAVRPLFLKRLADWKKVAEESQTVIAIKPHRGNAMSRPEQAVELLKELGESPWFRLCYDYSHFAFRDMPLPETIEVAAPWTAHIAVKDAAKDGDRVNFALPGEAGTIDYAALIKQFHALGYRGDVCIEVSSQVWRAADYDADHAIQISYRNMARAFEQAGISRAGG